MVCAIGRIDDFERGCTSDLAGERDTPIFDLCAIGDPNRVLSHLTVYGNSIPTGLKVNVSVDMK